MASQKPASERVKPVDNDGHGQYGGGPSFHPDQPERKEHDPAKQNDYPEGQQDRDDQKVMRTRDRQFYEQDGQLDLGIERNEVTRNETGNDQRYFGGDMGYYERQDLEQDKNIIQARNDSAKSQKMDHKADWRRRH